MFKKCKIIWDIVYLRLLETLKSLNSNYFKSFVSNNFTMKVLINFFCVYANIYN